MGTFFLFDGDCAFCTRSAELLRRLLPVSVRVLAWQAVDLVPLAVTAAQCAAAVQFVSDGRISAGPAAIADALRLAERRPWRLAGWLLGTRPVLRVAWPAYRLVARNRHRLPGGTAACELSPGARS